MAILACLGAIGRKSRAGCAVDDDCGKAATIRMAALTATYAAISLFACSGSETVRPDHFSSAVADAIEVKRDAGMRPDAAVGVNDGVADMQLAPDGPDEKDPDVGPPQRRIVMANGNRSSNHQIATVNTDGTNYQAHPVLKNISFRSFRFNAVVNGLDGSPLNSNAGTNEATSVSLSGANWQVAPQSLFFVGDTLIFVARDKDTTHRHLWKITLDSLSPSRLTLPLRLADGAGRFGDPAVGAGMAVLNAGALGTLPNDDARFLVTVNEAGVVEVLDPTLGRYGTAATTWGAHTVRARLTISPDGRYVASAYDKTATRTASSINIYDLQTGNKRALIDETSGTGEQTHAFSAHFIANTRLWFLAGSSTSHYDGYLAEIDGPIETAITVSRVSGSQAGPITSWPTDFSTTNTIASAWVSPNGNDIYYQGKFTESRNDGLWHLDRGTGQTTGLSSDDLDIATSGKSLAACHGATKRLFAHYRTVDHKYGVLQYTLGENQTTPLASLGLQESSVYLKADPTCSFLVTYGRIISARRSITISRLTGGDATETVAFFSDEKDPGRITEDIIFSRDGSLMALPVRATPGRLEVFNFAAAQGIFRSQINLPVENADLSKTDYWAVLAITDEQ